MTRPFFTRERISDFEIYDRNSDISLTQAKNRLAEGHSVDFQVSLCDRIPTPNLPNPRTWCRGLPWIPPLNSCLVKL